MFLRGQVDVQWRHGKLGPTKKFVVWFGFYSREMFSHRNSPPTYSDVGLWNNESAAYQKTVQKVRKQSNGPSMTMIAPVDPARKGRLWSQNELKNSLEPREIAVPRFIRCTRDVHHSSTQHRPRRFGIPRSLCMLGTKKFEGRAKISNFLDCPSTSSAV
jgi:hypothetical protein